MPYFDEIKFEVYSGSEWVDLSADVRSDPPPKVTRGILSNGILDRVGDVGQLTFSLDNSAGNSQATQGYYSPTPNPNTGGLIRAGRAVRLSFVFDGARYYKFYGRIAKDGVKVHAGTKGTRAVDVTVIDYIGLASAWRAELLTSQTNKRIDEAVTTLATSVMPVAPLDTSYATGLSTFPYIFDQGNSATTVYNELGKLALSELGYIYVKGDKSGGETLVVENRTQRWNTSTFDQIPKHSDDSGRLLLPTGDYILLPTGDKIVLSETQDAKYTEAHIAVDKLNVTYGTNNYNFVKVSITPRKIDSAATTVLYELQSPIEIEAGETITNVIARYRDPTGGANYVNGTDMVTPVANTDYKANTASNGTGTDRTASLTVSVTFGSAEALISFTNGHGSDTIYVGGDTAGAFFQLRGKGIYIYDTVEVKRENTLVQDDEYQYNIAQIILPYQTSVDVGGVLADQMVKAGGASIRLDNLPFTANKSNYLMFSFLALEPGDVVNVIETMSGFSDTSVRRFVNGYTFEILENGIVEFDAVLIGSGDVPNA